VQMLPRATGLSLRCNRRRMGDPGAFDPRSQERRDDPRKLSDGKLSTAFCMCCAVGVAFRMLPHDLPNWSTVYLYFRQWKRAGIWEQVNAVLRREVRVCLGRDPEPSAAILDSQSIKTSAVRGDERGYDAAKKNSGQKTASARGHARAAAGRQSAGG
jgi:transposase